ncbi:hypothetical protein [Roseimaritima sediminicola]|uniref:hypothetical protein n=1 Tax=Roseimaritima sediminicola TaxID=2662066 RepID=UPI001298346B|nr:hypothetical protein [Roseimaritima sediminicola]
MSLTEALRITNRTFGDSSKAYLSLMAYAEVIDVVIKGNPPCSISTSVLGPQPTLQTEQPNAKSDGDAGAAGC